MSRRHQHNPKKAFWVIIVLAGVLSIGILTYAFWAVSPQASGNSIATKVHGVITSPAKNGQIRIKAIATDGTESVAVKPFDFSAADNAAVGGRTYSTTFNADLGQTYKAEEVNTTCSVTFTLPTKADLGSRTKVVVEDTRLQPTVIPSDTFVLNLAPIIGNCAPATASTSATATPTAAPTTTVTASTKAVSATTAAPAATTTAVVNANATATPGDPVPVPFELAACNEQFDFLIVADGSGSMNDESNRGPLMKKFVDQAVTAGKFHTGKDNLGLVKFSSPANVAQDFGTDYAGVKAKVDSMTFDHDASDIAAGVRAASKEFAAKRRGTTYPGIVLVISDNTSSMSADAKTIAQADSSNLHMRYFTVSVGGRNNNLADLARAGGGSYTNITAASQVNTAVETVFGNIDSLVDNCGTANLALSSDTIVGANTITATFTITNHTRGMMNHSVITQPLPVGLTAADGSNTVSTVVDALASGEKSVQTVTIKGNNQ